MDEATDLTKLTVYLTAPAREALDAAAFRLGEPHTDVVNRALLMYNTLDTVEEGEAFAVRLRPGDDRTLVVLDAAPAGRWWWRVYTSGVAVALAFALGLLVASALWWAAS